MRALFLARVANGQPLLPKVHAETGDKLAYVSAIGKWRGGWVVLSPLGLSLGEKKELQTRNAAIVLVRAPDAQIAKMKGAGLAATWFWLGEDVTDEKDDGIELEAAAPAPRDEKRGEEFRKWLILTVKESRPDEEAQKAWDEALAREVLTTEEEIMDVAYRLCGVTWEQVRQGMIA